MKNKASIYWAFMFIQIPLISLMETHGSVAPFGTFFIVLIIINFIGFKLHAHYWKCPNCFKYLGSRIDIKFCASCGCEFEKN